MRSDKQRALKLRLSGRSYNEISGLLRIGRLASLAGVPIPTVRFYINQGLIKPEGHTKGGFMLFNRDTIDKIKEIKKLQEEKRLRIAEIKRHLSGQN